MTGKEMMLSMIKEVQKLDAESMARVQEAEKSFNRTMKEFKSAN